MRLKELKLNHFGKFHNTSITLKDGINLIYGDNEAGKTTIHSFIRGMLFGIEKLRGRASKDDLYLKYQPWETPGVYSGSMDIEADGKMYRILRNFDKNTKGYSIIHLETGRELNLNTEEMTELYGGLTEAGYRNTISIEQLKARTDHELVEEVRNYITNLSLSKSNEVDLAQALNFLQDKRKVYESQQMDQKLAFLEKKIEEGLAREAKMDSLTLQLKELEEQERQLLFKRKNTVEGDTGIQGFSSLEQYNSFIEQFPAIKEKYKNYCELILQREVQKEKLDNLQYQIEELEQTQVDNIHLKNEIAEMDRMKAKLMSIIENQKKLSETYSKYQKTRLRYIYVCLILTILAGIFLSAFLGLNQRTIITVVEAAIAGGILYRYLSKDVRNKTAELKKNLDENERYKLLLQEKGKLVLIKVGVTDETELRNKYNGVLRQALSMEHQKKELLDCQVQAGIIETRLKSLKEQITAYGRQLSQSFGKSDPSSDISRETMDMLENYVLQQKQKMNQKQEELSKEYETLVIQKEKIKWELDALAGNEVELLKNRELYKEYSQKKQENEMELSAIKLAADTLNELSVNIHNSFGKELNYLVSRLAGQITNGKYEDIKIDEKLNIKVAHEDNYVRLDNLSAGTIGQLYFALRYGISDLLYGKGTMPVILDDCFALYDDTRTKAALNTLVQEGKSQIIIFTCHNREKAILDELNQQYNYIDLTTL